MRTLTTILLVLLVILFALADPAQPDTIATQELSEVVVKAPKVIHKADMDIYIPSKATLEISKNGMQLLANLMIPSLSVSDALGTIKAAGQPVQVRINERSQFEVWGKFKLTDKIKTHREYKICPRAARPVGRENQLGRKHLRGRPLLQPERLAVRGWNDNALRQIRPRL